MRTAIEESAGVCGTVIDQSTSSPVIDNRYVVVCQARQRLLRLPPTARLLAVPSAPSAVNRVVDVDVHAAARRRLPLKNSVLYFAFVPGGPLHKADWITYTAYLSVL